MGLVDKLTEVDKTIWHGYEKVTNYCNQEFGWDKYSLAKGANLGQSISYFGGGLYFFIEGLQSGNNGSLMIGGMSSLYALGSFYVDNRDLQKDEKKEIALLEKTSATTLPRFKPSRPVIFVGLSAFGGYYLHSYATQQELPPELSPLSSQEYNLFGALIMASFLSSNLFRVCKSYFQDQIMTPPKKKKKVLKTLYQKVKGKARAVQVPQLEPVKEPTKCQSIDDLAGGA